MNAVLALGLIGAGTNNARLAGMLRQLSSYYYKCDWQGTAVRAGRLAVVAWLLCRSCCLCWLVAAACGRGSGAGQASAAAAGRPPLRR